MSALEPNQPPQGKVKAQINWICKIVGHRWEIWRYANFKLGFPSVPTPGQKCVYRCTRKNCKTVWGRITPSDSALPSPGEFKENGV